jgi:hypothetical protein
MGLFVSARQEPSVIARSRTEVAGGVRAALRDRAPNCETKAAVLAYARYVSSFIRAFRRAKVLFSGVGSWPLKLHSAARALYAVGDARANCACFNPTRLATARPATHTGIINADSFNEPAIDTSPIPRAAFSFSWRAD